jgi:hypothetical protein
MAAEPTKQWREPTPITSDDEGSSSDESTSYEEEVLTPRPDKKHCTEEEEDPTYSLTGPSTRASRTPAREQADDEELTQRQEMMTSFSLKYETNACSCPR